MNFNVGDCNIAQWCEVSLSLLLANARLLHGKRDSMKILKIISIFWKWHNVGGYEKRTISYARLLDFLGFPGGTVVKNLPANAGDTRDTDSMPGSGRSPGVGNEIMSGRQ